jgi:orotate phosphoribosyltransferase
VGTAAKSQGGEREALRALLASTIRTGEIRLASGRTTDFYFDGRLVTLDPRGLSLVARLAHERIAARVDAVGGPTSGADPIVAGIGQVSLAAGRPLRTFFTRKEAKGHGTGRRLEGPPLQPGDRVFIVDDVATSGGSLLQSAKVVQEDTPARVVGALVIIDREEGADELLAESGIPLEALFLRSDFL